MNKWLSAGISLLGVLYLTAIWQGAHREIVWFMLPFAGLFRQIGGTWWKFVGRFLTPAMALIACYSYLGLSWWLLVVAGAILIAKTLPVTFGGNSTTANLISRLWVWLLGLFNGLVWLSVGFWTGRVGTALFAALVPMFVYGIFITLSNWKATRRYFVWKFVEFMMGASAIFPLCLQIELYLGKVIP